MYIEINLLPQSFRPKRSIIKFDFKLIMILVVVVGVAGVGWYYQQLQKSMDDINANISSLRKIEASMRDAVVLSKEVTELTTLVEERVNIIRDLTGDSDVLIAMLEHINIIMPQNLWLLNITEDSAAGLLSYSIEGMSYSKDNISDFLAGLKKFEKFTKVSLESIRPAPLEIRDAFSYSVRVDLVSTKPPEEAVASSPRRRRSRR